jgi:hypothetical protein
MGEPFAGSGRPHNGLIDGDEKAVALNKVQAYLKGVEAKREDRQKRLLRFASSR